MKHLYWLGLISGALAMASGCTSKHPPPADTLFVSVDADSTGVYFSNLLKTNDTLNLFSFEYLYNGGGVGIGDFDNDGLPDIFFTGNQVPCKLYLNKGDFRFKDISETAGIDSVGWAFGVSVADVNADGWDDIYVSVAGMGNMDHYPNRLFINQHNLTFKEMSATYGLDDRGESIQAAFLDYDHDGDLDMYLLTGGGFERSPIVVRPQLNDGTNRNTDRLYRNDFDSTQGHPVFTDVSREAGITHEGFGLGVSVLDVNKDQWPDLYVTNDYQSNDHLYINDQNGAFTEGASDYFAHTSHFAMGNDVGDINNDGLMDIISTDMLPFTYERRKLMFGPNYYNKFMASLDLGYLPQYMRNTLQVNTGQGRFSEIGQLAGVDKTDWSWSVLLADLDNDEYQDIFITNGFGKDVTDLDFVMFRSGVLRGGAAESKEQLLSNSLEERPGLEDANVAFRNKGSYTFERMTDQWGFSKPMYSNGAAYVDLDADGDLDLVINNIDERASLYRNTLREKNPLQSHYLKVQLLGPKANRHGVGCHITIKYAGRQQVRYQSPVRGFESSVDQIIHFGLGENTSIDTLQVQWPDGRSSQLVNLKVDQRIMIDYSESLKNSMVPLIAKKTLFNPLNIAEGYSHDEVPFPDFDYEPLLPVKYSHTGPSIAVGDMNGDGLEDFFVGGAFGKKGTIFTQQLNGTFITNELEGREAASEDTGSLLFDADGDKDLDLYVVSGGSEYTSGNENYQDRLYRNDGAGNFLLDSSALPEMIASGSCVVAADYDLDGDLDLFVGGRVVPGNYPNTPQSFLLRNETDGPGRQHFTNVTDELAPGLANIGMVTNALWTDTNNDYLPDLMVVGEWMPITLFSNRRGKLVRSSRGESLKNTEGWWQGLVGGDFDNDGDTDYIAGNLGLNTHYKASEKEPLQVYYGDFDSNGANEAILAYYEEGVNRPVPSLDDLTKQLPFLKNKLLYHRDYAEITMQELLDIDGMAEPQRLLCKTLQSVYIQNNGNNTFETHPMPIDAQWAPLYGMLAEDFDGDGNLDLVAVGNARVHEVVYGQMDALVGLVLLGNGLGQFSPLPATESGFFVPGDGRGLVRIVGADNKPCIVAAQNNGPLKAFTLDRPLEVVSPAANETVALLEMDNGGQRRIELPYGSSYLSQSSRTILITPQVKRIVFYGVDGEKRARFIH